MRSRFLKSLRSVRLSTLLLSLLIPLASLSAQQEAGLVGTWRSQSEASLIVTFNDDGTGKLGGASVRYSARGNKLTVNDSGTVNTYTFSLNGDILKFSGGDLDEPLVLERQKIVTTGGLGARKRQASETADVSSTVVGTWERSDEKQAYRLTLKPDGNGVINGVTFHWTFEQGILVFQSDSGTFKFSATVTPDSLTLSGGPSPTPAIYKRVKTGEESSARQNSSGASAKSGSGLVGRWKSDQYTVQISGNGTISINGEVFRYSVQGKVMALSNNDGSLQIPFELNDDTLVTTYNGQQTVYRRMSGSDEDVARSVAANPAQLVGKWCYMSNVNASNGGRMSNRCFTLYQNGNYEYYGETSSSGAYGSTASQESDGGTWSATESTITANSRSRGTLVFRLEKRNHRKTGDPMLVLDGDAFVTATQRTPW